MPFVSYWIFQIARGKADGGMRLAVAAFLSGYIGLVVASLVTACEFGIQPLIAIGTDGRPLYAPYPLSITLPAMAIEHLFPFGIVEGLVTMLLLEYFMKNERDLIYAITAPSADK
jgi:cobalt/nickel transport system permease protein